MKTLIKCLLLLNFSFLFIQNFQLTNADKEKDDKCKICTELVVKIIERLDKTAKGNFGGGNTDWEDRKLGNYATSETRFEEICDKICSESMCHTILEEQEDYLFNWFRTKQDKIKTDLHKDFCMTEIKACCPMGEFGPSCKPCPRDLNQTCSGNGKCDGDGRRVGRGKCNCDVGYQGESCQNCNTDGFYEQFKNETFLKCSECHQSCSKCVDESPSSCMSCKSGWLFDDETKVCNDVDECLSNKGNCKENQFCQNNYGSFNCIDCNEACLSCTGTNDVDCIECKKGYRMSEDKKCLDIDECEEGIAICEEQKNCVNTKGAYKCQEQIEDNDESTMSESVNKEEL